MLDRKHPLKSLGIMGPAIALIVFVANQVHPGLGLTDADVAPAIDAVDTIAGFLLAIYGRWRATQRIGLSAILLAALLPLTLPLGACSGVGANLDAAKAAAATGPAASPDPLAVLAKFTLTDLQHAKAMADAGNDKLASLCYGYLATQIAAQSGGDPNASVAGLVSGFEKQRLLLRNLNAGLADDFQINCAPFLSDVRLNIARLAALAGGAAVLGAASAGAVP